MNVSKVQWLPFEDQANIPFSWRTMSGERPRMANIPVCFVMWLQSPGVSAVLMSSVSIKYRIQTQHTILD